MNRQDFQAAVASLPFGKVLPGARYLYLPPESTLDSPIAPLIAKLRDRLGLSSSHHIIKLAHADFAISFLDYPDFLTHAHPELREAIRIQLATGSVKRIDFSTHANPPILHRKESFLPRDHPKLPLFASLTRAQESAGLYQDPSRIGFRDNWEEILRSLQLTIIGHSLHTTNTTGEERSAHIPVPAPDRGPRGLENPRSFPATSSTTGLSHSAPTTGEERSADIPVADPDRGRRGLENPRSFPAASSTTGLSHSAPTTGEERSAHIPVAGPDRGPRGLENPRSFPATSSTTGLSHSAPTTGEVRSADIPVPAPDRGPRGLENPRSFPAASSTTGLSHSAPAQQVCPIAPPSHSAPSTTGLSHSAPHAPPVILRHRTALARSELSKPIRTALASSLLRPSDSVFDFGCGHGTDVAALNAYGIPSAGWDPAFFPHNPITPASFVNLGFVLNVIESPAERVDVLQHAWKLTTRVLLVSTMIRGQEDYSVIRPHADGYLTSRSTFQKYFDPSELQGLIEHALDADAHPAGLGIYAVFRNPQDAQDWLAEKIRRPVDWDTLSRKLGFLRPSIERRAVDAYEANRELLDACWLRMLDLGRFPTPDEFDRFHDLKSKVGSPRTVTRIFTTRFGDATLESARQLRRDDLLAYLALANFRKKIPLKYLSDKLQADIRSFFGTYEGAPGRTGRSHGGCPSGKRPRRTAGQACAGKRLLRTTGSGLFREPHEARWLHRPRPFHPFAIGGRDIAVCWETP